MPSCFEFPTFAVPLVFEVIGICQKGAESATAFLTEFGTL